MSTGTFEGQGSLLKRHFALLAALTGRFLSLVDCIVFAWLTEYAGGDRHEAWPSLRTLARVSGLAPRQVVRSIGRLRSFGYIAVSRPGTPSGRSTRHILTLKGAEDIPRRKAAGRDEGDDFSDTTIGADDTVTRVVTNEVEGGDSAVPQVVTAMSPKPPMNRAAKRGSMGGGVDLPTASRPAASTAAVAAGSPGGDRPSAMARAGVVNTWFFDIYPECAHRNVAAADVYLTKLLESGVVDRETLETAVRAYAEYVYAAGLDHARKVKWPMNWLTARCWLDTYHIPAKKAPNRAQTAASGGRKGVRKAPSQDTSVRRPEAAEIADIREEFGGGFPISVAQVVARHLIRSGHINEDLTHVNQLATRITSAFEEDDALAAELLVGETGRAVVPILREVCELRFAAQDGEAQLRRRLGFKILPHLAPMATDVATEIVRRGGEAFGAHPEATDPDRLRDSLAGFLITWESADGVSCDPEIDPRFDEYESWRGLESHVAWFASDMFETLVGVTEAVGREWPQIELQRQVDAGPAVLPEHRRHEAPPVGLEMSATKTEKHQ